MGDWRRRLIGLVGVAGVGAGLWLAGPGAVLAGLGGAALALSAGRWAVDSASRRRTVRPLDFSHTLHLLQRAHDARAGWAVGLRGGEVTVDASASHASRERGAALVRLASVDGRTHVAREVVGTFVAVGDFPYGAGLLLTVPDAVPAVVEVVAEELRRLVATMRLAEMELPEVQRQLVARQLVQIASGAQTLQGLAKAGAELAQHLSQRPVAVVVRAGGSARVEVVAVSSAGDRRLERIVLSPESAVCQAITAGLPVVTRDGEDVFGPGVPERRRVERGGTAYPFLDGHVAVGALVVSGAPVAPDGPLAEQLGRLVMELGPRLAAARSVEEAERRAVSDPLTGLRNRRELMRALGRFSGDGPASLIYADLDHFKQLNDTLGHAAGDAALQHITAILQAHVREGDLVTRIGGEEFAIWLPTTPLRGALEVAGRVRQSVEQTVWQWQGAPYPLTTSCGVAGLPEDTGEASALLPLADAALYRAKQAGRNRVEKAGVGA